jgi:hypothetical protein
MWQSLHHMYQNAYFRVSPTRLFSVKTTPSQDKAADQISSPDPARQHLREACETGDMETAMEILFKAEEMRRDQDSSCLYWNQDDYTRVLDGVLSSMKDLEMKQPGCAANVKEMLIFAEQAERVLTTMMQQSNIDDAAPRPTMQHYNTVIQAFTRLTRAMRRDHVFFKGIPQRAEHILTMMQQECSQEPLLDTRPLIESYNCVMEAWGNSSEYLRGTYAKKVFDKMLPGMQRNAETHRTMIRTWIKSDEKLAAHRATWHLTNLVMCLRKGDKEMEPMLEDYHLILEAWSKARDRNRASKARTVFRHIEEGYLFGHSEVQPDELCYRYLLEAYASSTLFGQGQIVDQLLSQMKDHEMIPDARCYSAAIRTWNNQVRHKKCSDHHGDALRCYELLTEMEKAHHRSSTSDIKPKTDDYNLVLQALSYSEKRGAAERAESLLSRMEKAAIFGNEDIIPDSDSYALCLYALSRSASPDKLTRALDILNRNKDADKRCHPTVMPNERVLTAFITVCGKISGETSVSDKKNAYKLMIRVVDEMRESGLVPNSRAYSWLISACKKLLLGGEEREQALRYVFKSCCNDGMVDPGVLRIFRMVAPEDLYHHFVVKSSSGDKSGNYVPREWTKNIGRNTSAGNRRREPPPLTLEQGFDFKPSHDKRMKKLRSKTNQRLLRGGRIE